MTFPFIPPAAMGRRGFVRSAVGIAALAAPALRAQSANRIVLGQSAAFTGAAAQLGIQFHAGAQLFFERYNAQSSGGRARVDIAQMDDGYEPDRCADNTSRLIRDDVFALFGYIGTPTSVVALPLATQAEVPFIAPFTGAMSLRQPFNRMAFHLRASYNDETELIVRNLHNLGLTRVAVFYQNDAYGRAGLDGMNLALAARQLKPVATATVERNTVDVAQAVATINAAKPQAVVQISAYKSCAAYIRAARRAGYGGSFYNVSFVGTQALADELGKDGAGVVVSQVVPNPYTATRPITREFREAIAEGGNKVQPNFSSLEGYLAARLLAEGLRRAGAKPTREGLISGLESVGEQSLGGFAVSLGARDHVASSYVELSMLTGDGKVKM
jgi:ABC-type branched-subunit amino acid transport system substrate-binding protein